MAGGVLGFFAGLIQLWGQERIEKRKKLEVLRDPNESNGQEIEFGGDLPSSPINC